MSEFSLEDTVIEIDQPEVPRVDVPTPVLSIANVNEPDFLVDVENPDIPTFEMPMIDTSPDVVIMPLPGPKGDKGDPGDPGSGGGGAVREVYVQETEPTQGSTPWTWYQLDADGHIEFVKVYEP